MSKFKVFIADKTDKICQEILKSRGIEPIYKPGLSPEELKKELQDVDGLIVRSATKVTADIIENAKKLKAVVRAGSGVDTIDVKACTAKNIVVMNTPYGNIVSTAEHAIALMFALARKIPQANTSTHAGKWEKNKFEGVELTGKTLGIVGCGNVGSIVADRAKGLKMNVIVYDPALNQEKANAMGVKIVTLDELYAQSDFITFHVTLNDKTKGMVNKETISKMKKGVMIINCSRGAIFVEEDVKEAVLNGHIAGLAVDVYAKEPATEHIFFGVENIIATPHIAASTKDAQIAVARQAAEQIADYLLTGKKTHSVN